MSKDDIENLPGIATTEWGIRGPWGDNAAEDYEAARRGADNMRGCGHDASIIWRGVTQWQSQA